MKRPRLPPRLLIQLTPKLDELVRKRADSNFRSISGEINYLLALAIKYIDEHQSVKG